MIYFLNGAFVPEEEAKISVLDRGFLYGDGLFETMRGLNFKMPLWNLHWKRLSKGSDYLGIKIPFGSEALRNACQELLRRNQMAEATLRITLTRGVGIRGYSPKGANNPTVAITIHPLAPAKASLNVIVSNFILPADDPIAAFKTCNKIRQILARAEADLAGADEAILVNEKGFPVEGSSANLFWFEGDILCTPPLYAGVLPGVTRTCIFRAASKLGFPIAEITITPAQLSERAGVFLSASNFGCVPVGKIDGEIISPHPGVKRLQERFAADLAELAR